MMEAMVSRVDKLTNSLVMIIAGDARMVMNVSNTLRELGVPFQRNTTGANVIAQLRSLPRLPDAILLAFDLPQGNALAIIEELRQDPELAQIPVIGIGCPFEDAPASCQLDLCDCVPRQCVRQNIGAVLRRALDVA